ncbi:MAG TPA: polyprenyl diphosphate synthase [Candidatus Nanoarchaeia archaeon]|nr:polyprenyl diphosphate synthase [Candidatus Nanoarchaeia archaeon]
MVETVPKHIGIILDGNRRFAKRLMLKPWKGHEWGAEKFRKFLDWSFELGIEEVTAYVFSIQNFQRPKEEFDVLMNIFTQEAKRLLALENLTELKQRETKIRYIGRLWLLPSDLQELARQVMDATKDNGKRAINFAMAYGGREEIIDAVQRIAAEVKEGKIEPSEIDENIIAHHLWLESSPDMIIRTGGEKRTSNFLPWQGTYSELFFVEKYWPEIEKEDLVNCITEFSERERRFGK